MIPATGDGNGTGPGHQRTPFLNNQIPFSRVNPVSLTILKGVNAAALTNGILNPNAPLSKSEQQLHNQPSVHQGHEQLRYKNRLGDQ